MAQPESGQDPEEGSPKARTVRRAEKRGGPPKDWRDRFLHGLRETFNVEAARRFALVSKDTVYSHRRKDPDFAKAWDEALEIGRDTLMPLLEQAVALRAIYGTLEPVYHGAKRVGWRRVFNVTREIWMMKHNLADRYDPERLIRGSEGKSAREFADEVRGLLHVTDGVIGGEDPATVEKE